MKSKLKKKKKKKTQMKASYGASFQPQASRNQP